MAGVWGGSSAPPSFRRRLSRNLLALERPAGRVFRVQFCLRALLFVPLLSPQIRPFPVTVYSGALPLCANLAQACHLDVAVAGASLMYGSSGSDGSSVAEQSAPRPSQATHYCGQDTLFVQPYGMCKQLPNVSLFYRRCSG